MSNNMTLLTQNQVWGDNSIDLFKLAESNFRLAHITDFALLLGGSNKDGDYFTDWWVKNPYPSTLAEVAISSDGKPELVPATHRNVSVRPALPYSAIESVAHDQRYMGRVKVVKFGEYPQTACSKKLSKLLETRYKNHELLGSSKKYTLDGVTYDNLFEEFSPLEYNEYHYLGEAYIRVDGGFNGLDEVLSNGEKVKAHEPYWIKVEPIEWLVDEKADIALSRYALFAGVQYNYGTDVPSFESTNLKKYLDKYFSQEILTDRSLAYVYESPGIDDGRISINIDEEYDPTEELDSEEIESVVEEKKTRLEKMNPDTTKTSQRMKMTDTELIHSWVEAGQSVLLRGPSGIGKTERLKTLYPNLIYIKLTNNMFPEKVVGSMNLQTGQNIPPDFAKQALMECATDEERKLIRENVQNLYDLADEIYERSKNSDEKIVILLDELLNVKPAVQSLVYTLVLNKLVESGKGLKLPANTVIVATGNQKKYSNVAEDLAEPLEKRFDHILDMEPKVGEWLSEYAIPNKIHPAVIGYILSKYNQAGKSEEIEDINYFYEEPEAGEKNLDRNGCKGRTNDPRGWVSISNTLYAFEKDLRAGKFIGKNVEHIVQMSIGSKLREEWANEFFNFYNIPTLSVEDVVSGKYGTIDLPTDINERFACVTALLLADENQVGKCREFIRKYCDPEYLQLYDLCWIGNDESRMMKIAELRAIDSINKESAGRSK